MLSGEVISVIHVSETILVSDYKCKRKSFRKNKMKYRDTSHSIREKYGESKLFSSFESGKILLLENYRKDYDDKRCDSMEICLTNYETDNDLNVSETIDITRDIFGT